jgi:hypothetical protein
MSKEAILAYFDVSPWNLFIDKILGKSVRTARLSDVKLGCDNLSTTISLLRCDTVQSGWWIPMFKKNKIPSSRWWYISTTQHGATSQKAIKP